MKLVAGLSGSADSGNVRRFVDLGIGEFFAGFVPKSWSDRWGFELSPNRRYREGNQVDRIEHLGELIDAAHAGACKFVVTFNEHYYSDVTWASAAALVQQVVERGADALVFASPAACKAVAKEHPGIDIHVSGDAGVANRAAVHFFHDLGARRIIFPRHLSLDRIEKLAGEATSLGMETEAFVMGEPCVFDGARCFSGHGYGTARDFCNAHSRIVVADLGSSNQRDLPRPKVAACGVSPRVMSLGRCGLCAIERLRAAKVGYLKVPGRATDISHAIELVLTVMAGRATGPALLQAPELCASGEFCYYPPKQDR